MISREGGKFSLEYQNFSLFDEFFYIISNELMRIFDVLMRISHFSQQPHENMRKVGNRAIYTYQPLVISLGESTTL